MPDVPLWAFAAVAGVGIGVVLGGIRDVLHEVAESSRLVRGARHRDHSKVPPIK